MMGQPVGAKICGLRKAEDVAVAAKNGAHLVGFVFYEPSPRSVEPELAKRLVASLPEATRPVGVFVNPTDDELSIVTKMVPGMMIQLHGEECPRRVAQIKQGFSRPVIKAIGIESVDDVKRARAYQAVADMLMFDAKVRNLNSLPGGNAVSFDWHLLAGGAWDMPWILGGGLTADNVGNAVGVTGARMVDVSSGVEDSRGLKNQKKIKEFLAVTKVL